MAQNGLLDIIQGAYMRNVGNPARQLLGGGVRGLLGFDPPEYADNLGMEAYRNAAAMGNAPGINAPVGAFKAAAKVVPEAAMFIGALAKTWDKASNAKAVQMEKAGKDARDIWRETGNLKGPDGKWRQEISDQGANITDAVFDGIKETQRFEGPMATALTHPSLYQAYPDTGKIGSGFYAWRTPEGAYQAATDTITAGGPGTTSQKSAALHELQHAIQQREGFAKGGSPGQFKPNELYTAKQLEDAAIIDKLMTSGNLNQLQAMERFEKLMLRKPDTRSFSALERVGRGKFLDEARDAARLGEDPAAAYRRLAGEAEARATQARMGMAPAERRATFPYDSYDVPVDQLIVRGLLAP